MALQGAGGQHLHLLGHDPSMGSGKEVWLGVRTRESSSGLCSGLARARDLEHVTPLPGPQFPLLTNDCKNFVLPPRVRKEAEVGNKLSGVTSGQLFAQLDRQSCLPQTLTLSPQRMEGSCKASAGNASSAMVSSASSTPGAHPAFLPKSCNHYQSCLACIISLNPQSHLCGLYG